MLTTRSRADEVDAIVRSAFEQTSPAVTVVAVGGYGRRELFPASDVDLLLLTNSPASVPLKAAVGEFLRILWDAKLRIGHSVHTPAECCEIHDGNLELTISLLDHRYLCGNTAAFNQLSQLLPKFLSVEGNDITSHLARMTKGRHSKYGDTIYHLEPNVKEHPGGLRDLHVIHWLELLRATDPEAQPDTLLDEARAFLFDVRTRLHQYFRRDNNLLSFEAQELLNPHPADWMREYYRNARQIHRAVRRCLETLSNNRGGLISQFRDWRAGLSNPEFAVSRDQLTLRDPDRLASDPTLVPRLMKFLARHQLRLAPETEIRLESAAAGTFGWPEWHSLLLLPQCANALRALADLGLMKQLIPEWGRIDCLVVRDFYHRYTVDEHTLVAIQTLEELPAAKDPAQTRFATLLTEIDRLDLLRLALLLHDVGKGAGAGDHARHSVLIARDVLQRLDVPAADQQTVLFLIEHHLDLSVLMTTRDLHEESSARQIAECAGTVEHLKLLALLTYADISAVNPTAMTPWRLEQLWLAYLVGHQEFTRELETERIHLHQSQTSPEAADFLEGFPTRYLKTHTPPQIAGHIELARGGTAVHLAKLDGTYRITVISKDRAGLLASISGALASFGLNIVKAEAFNNSRGQALDTFVFADPLQTLELNPGEQDSLQDLVRQAALGQADITQLMQKRRAPAARARVEPAIRFANDVSETSTLIEITAEDRPGLLYDLAQTISESGADIEVVLIDTEAHRALDVFYARRQGGKLSDVHMDRLREKLLEACRG